ncbi:unnamed protein product [Symbiodinium pilosum]|uniref:Uncharacterized protein n=1 Tax=Symbiodinium pilosum TaxID=2952 RepID=A0A812Y062_SYMPI|nr:unnamed protein product [Symbiodinium pilosum]
MPIHRWESLIPNLIHVQAPKVLLLMWTQNIDLRMQVEMFELFAGKYIDARGVKRFVGNKKDLRASGSYSRVFGKRILELWDEERASTQPRLCLRQKTQVSQDLTDRELFSSLQLGDTWPDAELVQVWCYLYNNKNLMIPPTWQATMDAFHSELKETAPCPEPCVFCPSVICNLREITLEA